MKLLKLSCQKFNPQYHRHPSIEVIKQLYFCRMNSVTVDFGQHPLRQRLTVSFLGPPPWQRYSINRILTVRLPFRQADIRIHDL
jgi:hypothetical protein